MARIPMGNFQTATMVPNVERGGVVTPNPSDSGVQALAGSVQQVAGGMLQQRIDEAKAMSRVKASNLLMDRESQVRTITADLGEKLRQGLIEPDKAQSAYQAAIGKLDPIQPQGLDQVEMEQFGLGLRKVQESGLQGIERAVGEARIATARSDLDSRMDLLGKDAALPGAKPEALIARMDAEDIDTVGRMAYGVDWERRKQSFKDGVYMTHATQQLIGARNDLGALQNLQTQLTAEDGYYTTKLDPDRRNQLLNSVTGKIFQVQEHNARQAEFREQRAMRILDQMDRQAATGIPPSPAEQQRWKAALSGTSMAGEYATRVEQMNQVQTVLRMPLADQQAFIQQQRQQLAANGGSTAQIANVDRLERAVESNMKQMRDQPLEWNAMRTGAAVEPLDFSGLNGEEGLANLSAQIASRMDTINAMRVQIGPEVSRNPFLPQEAGMLKAALAQADDNTKLQVVGAIAKATNNANDFSGALKAIASDDPSLMLAGMAQASNLKGSDGTDVAQAIMQGKRVLAEKSSVMPEDTAFQDEFTRQVGSALPAGTEDRERGYLAFKSVYAALAEKSGVVHDNNGRNGKLVNSTLAEKAMELAVGGISEIGGKKIVRPHGMQEQEFKDSINSQLDGLSQETGVPARMLRELPLMEVPGADGKYFLLNGLHEYVNPKTGKVAVISVRGSQ